MPKKPQRNGFYWYMQDLIPVLRAEGHQIRGIDSVVPIAHPRWKLLSEDEKAHYEQRARDERNNVQTVPPRPVPVVRPDRQDNVGNVISQRKRKDDIQSEKLLKEKEFLSRHWPRDTDALLEQHYFFIAMEYFVEIPEEKFLPREIGIIEYSFNDGIIAEFHRIIDPGPPPLGYRYKAQQQCEEVHRIPLDYKDATKDYKEVYDGIANFINPGGHRQTYPPLFGMESNMPAIEYGMKWLQEVLDMNAPSPFQIYNLDNLVTHFYTHADTPLSITTAMTLLTACTWDYAYNTRCHFHEEEGHRVCALGSCKRYAFALSDGLCDLLGFEQTSNHLPPAAKHVGVRVNNRPTDQPVVASDIYTRNSDATERQATSSSSGFQRSAAFPYVDYRATQQTVQPSEFDDVAAVDDEEKEDKPAPLPKDLTENWHTKEAYQTHTGATKPSWGGTKANEPVPNPEKPFRPSGRGALQVYNRARGIGRGNSVVASKPLILDEDEYPALGASAPPPHLSASNSESGVGGLAARRT